MKILSAGPLPELGLKMLKKEGHEVILAIDAAEWSTQELIEKSKTFDAVITMLNLPFPKSFFEASRHLKAVSIGLPYHYTVAQKWASKNNIPVGYVPNNALNICNEAVAETTLMLALSASRKLLMHHDRILTNQWLNGLPGAFDGQTLMHKTLGIYGLGKIGATVAGLFKRSLQMQVIYHNRSPNRALEKQLDAHYVPLDILLKTSDVLSVHAPLNLDSTGFFNQHAFYAMKPTAIFINTSHPKIHDQLALTRAVYEGWIWGAGLDLAGTVAAISGHHPLLHHPNVCVLPGIALATHEAKTLLSKQAALNIIHALRQERMPHPVNPSVYRYLKHS
ncbi:glyoxylate reductase [Arachidicoccus rhizosphaerae]|uniref:Glyoxylate reductase n=1 Tax=Arachidicoccus rhizosphaerae TaxID=551991 RepID=A0A1H4B0E8_9BACT|nr:NAD(P)-dependent oxidoreductase [Arachidicoccus rhizosphaerae]SEA41362.1 glyoxylate reductase [Arachidicoccus rhizosphaerae]